MTTKRKIKPFSKHQKNMLNKWIEKDDVDEMGLLDLMFREEILNPKRKRLG